MKRCLTFTTEPINQTALLSQRSLSTETGAVVCFLGVVRGTERGEVIRGIDYEVFQRMAEHQLELIFQEIEKRWPVQAIRLVHRVGLVPVGEPSFWLEIAAAHRGEAFAACQFLIDELKRLAPIWKKPAV